MFDAVLASANQALAAITPFSGVMLTDWERVLGVTPTSDESTAQRIDAVVAKLAQVGGLSMRYFTALASQLCYTITITEFDYAQAGVSHCGDTLYVEDILWCWQVNVMSSATVTYQAQAGVASLGDYIAAYSDPVIETIINSLKPAWTFVSFNYGSN